MLCSSAPRPGVVGAGEKPKPGRSGAMMWNAGMEEFEGLMRSGIILSHSRLVEGQPWRRRMGIASVRVLRWWMKWMSRGRLYLPPGGGTVVMKCEKLAFIWSWSENQLYSSAQYLARAVMLVVGGPSNHAGAEMSTVGRKVAAFSRVSSMKEGETSIV